MALEEGILFALLREGQKGKRRGHFFLVGEHWEIWENKTKKSKFFQQNKGQLFT